MTETLHTVLTIIFYITATVLHILNLKQNITISKTWLASSVFLGLIFQVIVNYQNVIADNGVVLNLINTSLIISAFITGLTLLISFRLPLEKLLIAILPINCLILTIAIISPEADRSPVHYGPGMLTHILLSILAYSTLIITTLDALLVAWQNIALKQHRSKRLITKLPAIQTLEKILFSLLWTGLILLTLSITTGFLFIDDLFAQHLVHKTVLSLMAWVIFLIVLLGHHLRGWRGLVVTYWIIAGCSLLILSYLGSKFVLEIILNRN